MEGSHYFLKNLRLESYIDQDPLPRVDLDNFDLDAKIKPEEHAESGGGGVGGGDIKDDGLCDKPNLVGDEVGQIRGSVQADDFFSSLELQSSSKTSSNVLSLSFSNKLTGGIVTRSRSFSSALHETAKARGKDSSRSELKERARRNMKKKRSETLCPSPKTKAKGKVRKQQDNKQTSSGGKDKISSQPDSKKQFSNKSAENILEKSLGMERSREDDDWILFNNLTCKKDTEENKHILANELQHPVRRGTPELFSINSILMSDGLSEGKDEVDNLLEVEDYDDSFLEEMDEFSYAPPRLHTGGKWKPGSLTVRTSPVLWQSQNWDSYLDDDRRNPPDTPTDFTADALNKFSVAATGGKSKSLVPPSSHTGGKWKPSDPAHRSKKFDPESLSPAESDSGWKYESDRTSEPPPTHTGGKWKPSSIHPADFWKPGTAAKLELEASSSGPATGKWDSGPAKSAVNRSTLDVLAKCQSTSGKCLKTSGGMIQYYCSPCNRRLSSKKMYNKHVQSELHFKRVLQENELEFDSRSLKLFHGLFTQTGNKERSLGKRTIKKPNAFKDSETRNLRRDKKIPTLVKIKGKKVARREVLRCEVCKVRVPAHQLGKHLVSYCHSRRIQLSDPEQQKLILDNIHAVVKQAPYQCSMCKFYCNTHASFKKHWSLPVHEEMEKARNRRFWCALCGFECETSRSMELHLDSNSHREVILAVNKSIPIIIRNKTIFRCSICLKEFRFNREYIHHNKVFHKTAAADKNDKCLCPVCQLNCKSIKSLQRHILNSHKGDTKVPYFCGTCNEFFSTAEEAKAHRNGQFHKYKKTVNEGGSPKRPLSRSCAYCEETLENVEKLKAHLLENHSEFLPKCTRCGMTFALSQEVSRHVKNKECNFGENKTRYSPSESFTCESCPFATNSKSEFLLHSALHRKNPDDDKKISCPLCGSLFSQTSLGIHLRTHLKERTYQCATCSKAFVRKDRYARHLRLRHGGKPGFRLPSPSHKEDDEGQTEKEPGRTEDADEKTTENPQKSERPIERQTCGDAKCKYVGKDLKDWENHRIFHVGPKIYQCPECPYSAKTYTIIKRSSISNPPTPVELALKRLETPWERIMSFKKRKNLPVRAKHPAKCGKASQEVEASLLMTLYTGDADAVVCGNLTNNRRGTHLLDREHYMIHVDERSSACPLCPFKARLKSHLKRHMRLHTGAKPYKCPHCPYTCNILENLRKHVLFTKIHPGKKLYECKFCSFSTNVSKEFKMHLFKNHKDDCRFADSNEVAGIYNREEDLKQPTCSIPVRPRTTAAQPSKKVYPAALKKKVDLLTQKFSPIAPKPECPKQDTASPALNVKSYKNSVEDKRNILKMELEKLKNQIKPPGKRPRRSYPSPPDAKARASAAIEDSEGLDADADPGDRQPSAARKEGDASDRHLDLDGELFLVNLTPAVVSASEEPALQQPDLPPVCILYENVLPSEEMELYLLKDYQV